MQQNVLLPTLDNFTLNVIDFDLFLAIADHPKLNKTIATQLLEIGLEIAYKNIVFTRVSLRLVLKIL